MKTTCAQPRAREKVEFVSPSNLFKSLVLNTTIFFKSLAPYTSFTFSNGSKMNLFSFNRSLHETPKNDSEYQQDLHFRNK